MDREEKGREEHIPLGKLLANIKHAKRTSPPATRHRFAALLSTGSFAPVHKMHLHIFEIAKKWLEENHGYTVVGGWMSPSHDNYVLDKLHYAGSPPITRQQRIDMCRGMVRSSRWVDVSSWEVCEDDFLDFPEVVDFHVKYLREHFNGSEEVTLMYLGGADLIERCGPVFGIDLEDGTQVPVVAVGRPGHTEALRKMVDEDVRWHRKLGRHVNDDQLHLIADETLDFSSTKVRKRLESGESVAELCGEEVEAYIRENNLHEAFLKKKQT